MLLVLNIAYLAVFLYVMVLLGRLVFEWIQVFARDWRPKGVVLVVAEAIYTMTDPPLRWLRSKVKPIRIGPVALDTSFLIVIVSCSVILWILGALMAAL